MIIDGTNLILGRLATTAAKKSLQGEEVVIVNCANVVVTGDKKKNLAKYKQKSERGARDTGPYIPRQSDKFVKRTIRGMLPYKKPRGRDAFKSIRCYVGVPENLKGEPETLKNADISKVTQTKHITVKELCKSLGGKI